MQSEVEFFFDKDSLRRKEMLNGKWRDQVNSSLFGINLLSYDQRVADRGW